MPDGRCFWPTVIPAFVASKRSTLNRLREERCIHQARLPRRDLTMSYELNRKCIAADKAPEQSWSTTMLAEIFMLRLEAVARAAKEVAPPSRLVRSRCRLRRRPNPSGGLSATAERPSRPRDLAITLSKNERVFKEPLATAVTAGLPAPCA